MKMAMKDGKIMLIEVDNTQMAIIKSWNSMKYDRRRNMMIGDCSKELLDKLSKIVRLPPAIESYRQRLDETQRAVDKMRVEKEPEALVKYPVQGSLYEHQVRAANMALLTFGLADPKEVLNLRKEHARLHQRPPDQKRTAGQMAPGEEEPLQSDRHRCILEMGRG